jgi:hypothetical protein
MKKIKVSRKNLTSLDGKHRDFINEFNKDEVDNIPRLKEERANLKQQILDSSGNELLEKALEMKDRVEEINQMIQSLKIKKKNYFLDNSKYIFEYFENKKDIDNCDSVKHKNKILDTFFKIDKTNTGLKTNNTNNIFQKYLTSIDESFLDINAFIRPTDICHSCYKGELIPMDSDGILICNNCSRNFRYLIENEKPSYKEPPKEVCFYAYKKINHFKEILSQFQGKETTQIPSIVIENLKLQIKKERIELNTLNYYDTKLLLKKLGYNKYYEHINFIKNKLGIKPPIISQDLEDKLCNFFMEIQYPYAKYCPDYRINFLHYYYVLYKLFELLGETEYLKEIPQLKDRSKLIEQDTIWKKICEDLNWEYICTI